jgi:hypothetical protein
MAVVRGVHGPGRRDHAAVVLSVRAAVGGADRGVRGLSASGDRLGPGAVPVRRSDGGRHPRDEVLRMARPGRPSGRGDGRGLGWAPDRRDHLGSAVQAAPPAARVRPGGGDGRRCGEAPRPSPPRSPAAGPGDRGPGSKERCRSAPGLAGCVRGGRRGPGSCAPGRRRPHHRGHRGGGGGDAEASRGPPGSGSGRGPLPGRTRSGSMPGARAPNLEPTGRREYHRSGPTPGSVVARGIVPWKSMPAAGETTHVRRPLVAEHGAA